MKGGPVCPCKDCFEEWVYSELERLVAEIERLSVMLSERGETGERIKS